MEFLFGWAQCPAQLRIASRTCAFSLCFHPAALSSIRAGSLVQLKSLIFNSFPQLLEVNQRGLTLFQLEKSCLILAAGKKLDHKPLASCCTLEVSAPHPGWCLLLWSMQLWAKNWHSPTSTASDWCMWLPGVLAILKGGPHGARNLKTTCLVAGIGLAPSHPAAVLGLCLPACAIANPQHKWFNESEQIYTATLSRKDFMLLPDFAPILGGGSQGDKVQLILLMSMRF